MTDTLPQLRDIAPDLPVEQLLAHTHPVEALLRHSRDARLVVVGSRGLGGLRAMVLGSVSREVLQHAGCPVAVVRVVPDRARNAALAG
jgi:nucleotide-binding universal stress UspA family protein